jgi:hypothetical protein
MLFDLRGLRSDILDEILSFCESIDFIRWRRVVISELDLLSEGTLDYG